jgi:hypothetical protein
MLTCNSAGKCVYSGKETSNGSLDYGVNNNPIFLSVSPDGSFGASIGPLAPSYAGAIANNGNAIIVNNSFDQDDEYDRKIKIGIRCSDCYNVAGLPIPMMTYSPNQNGNGLNLYLYEPNTQTFDTVKENSDASWGPSINIDQTMMVYTEGKEIGESDEPYTINIYDIASKTSTTLNTANTKHAAYFDKDGKILFLNIGINDNRLIKRMDPDGQNITTVATPQSPYTSFSVFWLSPDRQHIVAVEERTGDYQRLVLMNSDGTDRSIIKPEYLGYWNMLPWKPDSSGFFYYYHVGAYPGGTPKYAVINLDGSTIDLSNSDLGQKDENICFFTKSGNLLSLSYQELYNGQTGALIGSTPDVPLFTNSMIGWDNNGEIYFANLDGTNFRIFNESAVVQQYQLNVTKAGTGSGTVTSSPSGINCGIDCSESYTSGTQVTLTATPDSGTTFTGWSGDSDCSDGVVTMAASKTCIATFNIQQYPLNVTKSGTGTGTVTSNPSGIICGSDCSESYNSGTAVTLTSAPATGSTFASWSGCTPTPTDPKKCTVTVSDNTTVTATFQKDTNPPTGSIIINSGAEATKSKSVTLTLTASDDSGGSIQMCISNTNSCTRWTAFAATKSWSLTKGSGTKTVYVWFKDRWGNANAMPHSDTIILDTTAPVNGTVTGTPGNTQVTLNWSGFSDALSGIGSYKVVYSTRSAPRSCSRGTTIYTGSDTSYPHTGLINGTTYGYRVCAIDKAGNMSRGATTTVMPQP